MQIELEHQDDVCVVRIRGRFVTGADPEYLRTKTDEIKSRNCTKVLTDLHEMPFIGSTGIGFVVSMYISVTKRAGGRFVLAGANHRVREVFDLTRLSTVIPLAADTASGLAVCGQSTRNILM